MKAAVTLSSRYITGRLLPDKAVDLLDTSAARAKVVARRAPGRASRTPARHPRRRRARARGLRPRLHGAGLRSTRRRRTLALDPPGAAPKTKRASSTRRPPHQRAIVDRIDDLRKEVAAASAEAEAKRTRGEVARGSSTSSRPSRPKSCSSTPTSTSRSSPASSADWTGIPVGKMVQGRHPGHPGHSRSACVSRVRGQDPALAVIARELRAARAGLKPHGAAAGRLPARRPERRRQDGDRARARRPALRRRALHRRRST